MVERKPKQNKYNNKQKSLEPREVLLLSNLFNESTKIMSIKSMFHSFFFVSSHFHWKSASIKLDFLLLCARYCLCMNRIVSSECIKTLFFISVGYEKVCGVSVHTIALINHASQKFTWTELSSNLLPTREHHRTKWVFLLLFIVTMLWDWVTIGIITIRLSFNTQLQLQ